MANTVPSTIQHRAKVRKNRARCLWSVVQACHTTTTIATMNQA